jgi:hypothetical protein
MLTAGFVRENKMRARVSCRSCGNGTWVDLWGLPEGLELTTAVFRCRCGEKGRLTVEVIGKKGGAYGVAWRG